MFSKIAIITLCLVSCRAEWPLEIPRCVVGDLDCIVDGANAFVRDFKSGNAKLRIPQLDPYIYHNYTFNRDGDTPLRLKFHLPIAKLLGLSNITFTKAVGWGLDLSKSKYELYGRIPRLEIKGQYQAKGVVLFAPVQGNGDFHVILDDLEMGIKLKSIIVEKNGHPYLILKKIRGILEPSNGKWFLTNLFGDNKQLGDALNDLFNTNWRSVWDELAPHILVTLETVVKEAMQPFLNRHSWDEFFLPE